MQINAIDYFEKGALLKCREKIAVRDGSGEYTFAQVERLEREIDRLNERLQPLTSFVLPGGSAIAAGCHLARTICRRAERRVVTLMRAEQVNLELLKYLNRLSDLLFVLARVANDDGRADVLWVPGG